MGINRFSKDIAPAKFNPLSADEIMKVPMLKGQIEQEQLKAIEDSRLALLNQKVAPGDLERVNAKRKELSQGFDDLVSDITKNGVGYRTTDRINNFMKKYNTETSLSGDIGAAAEFEKSRQAKKAEDRALAIKMGYNMQDWDKLYTMHEGRQTSLNEDGTYNTEFQNINLPRRLSATDLLRDAYKYVGQYQERDADGNTLTSNAQNLRTAVDKVLSQYDTDPVFRQTMTDLGKTREDLARELVDEADMMVKTSNLAAVTPKLTPAQREAQRKAAEKAKAAADAEKDRDNETLLAEAEDGIERASHFYKDNKELEEMRSKASESDDARLEYLKAQAFHDRVLNDYNRGPGQIPYQQTKAFINQIDKDDLGMTFVDKKTNKPIKKAYSYEQAKDFLRQANGVGTKEVKKVDHGTGYTEYQQTGSYKNNHYEIVQLPDKSYVVVDTENPQLKGFKEVKDAYDNGLKDYTGKDSIHLSRTLFSLKGDAHGSGQGSNDNNVKESMTALQKAIKSGNDGFKIGLVKAFGVNGTEIKDDTARLYNDDGSVNETVSQAIKKQMTNLDPSEIKDIKFGPATGNRPAVVQLTYEIEEGTGKNKGKKTYVVNLDVKNQGKGPSGGKNAVGLFFDTLTNFKQGRELVEENKKNNKYQNIYARPVQSNEYFNNPEIRKRFQEKKPDKTVSNLYKNFSDDKSAFMVVTDGSGYGLKVSNKDAGKPGVVSYRDAFKSYKTPADLLAKNRAAHKLLYDQFLGIKKDELKGLSQAEKAKAYSDFVKEKLISTEPLVVGSKSDLFSILTESTM